MTARTRVFASLSVPNYRRYAAGALVSNTGTWMQRVAQDWLVLTELTGHSAVAVGITTGLQLSPALVLAPYAGVLADRLPRQRLMMLTQAAGATFAFVLGGLVVTGLAQLWMVYLLALALGVSTALEGPARQTFVSELVPRELMSNAVGLNSASFNAGRLLGPGLAGLGIAAVGTGLVFILNGLSFMVSLVALASLRRDRLFPMPRARRARGQIADGIRYVRTRPDLMVVMATAAVVGAFALNLQLTTALMATQVYHKGPGEYGLLGSITAVGSLGGALLAARRQRPTLRLFVLATLAFGASLGAAAVMPTYVLFAISLVPCGLSALTLMTVANATVQLNTDDPMRGRVMALYIAVFMGGTPIGSPMIGWVGDTFGARWALGVAALTCLIVGILAAAVLSHMRGVSLLAAGIALLRRQPLPAREGVDADAALCERPTGAARFSAGKH
ncbi:MAG: MFS transporter [Micrococcales bacterium]|nr:MAG: MFS transporter [Micrococcales bacterium]PIE25892.1 MAG: MFS transporter [Micrococcales bacterium]